MTALNISQDLAPASSSRLTPVPAFSYAFQPIVDTISRKVFSYEALIRGCRGEPAPHVLAQVLAGEQHRFDQESRAVAICLAARLGIACYVNLNLLPRSLLMSESTIGSTLEAAQRCGFPRNRIILEVTEGEVIDDAVRFAAVINEYRGMGLKVALDDFGAGYSGLNLLADFQPDMLKLDMNLIRSIDSRGPRQAIVRAILQACRDLGIDVIAEGVETVQEFGWLQEEGVRLFQGYLFARPAFENLPPVCYPAAPGVTLPA